MSLTVQDGKLVMQNGALGTGAACCCQASGCCCINGQAYEGYTQQTCEECATVNTCYETMARPVDDSVPPDENGGCPEGYEFDWSSEQCVQYGSCPEGWSPSGGGLCGRTTNPASCQECSGFCSSYQTGTCGKWIAGECQTPEECSETEHYCDCQCHPKCSIAWSMSGTETLNGQDTDFAAATGQVDFGPNGSWPSWAVNSDCSSIAGTATRGPSFNWASFFTPSGGVLVFQVTIPCDCGGYAIASPSVDGYTFYENPYVPGASVTVDNAIMTVVCE